MPEIKPQPFDIESHLHHITRRWGEIGQPVMVELVFLSAEDKAEVKHVARYRPDQIGQAADDAAAMNALGINVYCAINPIDANNQPKAGHRASREHIVGAFYHWADADDAQAAENIRNFVGPKCTMHVLTGTQPCMRPHVYWELVEFTRNLPEWEARQKAIAATLGTDPKVTDAPRIMRLAGSINWPKPAKRAKGYIAEVTTLRVYDPLERPPVSAERMARAFVGVAAGAAAGGLQIDTGMGASAMDRALATAQIKAGENWRGNVMSLVASYIARGWTDDEILDRCEPFTLPGYTVADTREDVAGFILWTRNQEARSGGRYATSPVGVPTAAPVFAQTYDDATAPEWPTVYDMFDESALAPRQWVYGKHYLRRFVSVLASAGGIGKTSMQIVEALAICTGRPLLGEKVEEQCNVWLINLEDPMDEMQRRILAAMRHYGIRPDEVRGKLFVDAGRDFSLNFAVQTREGITANAALVGHLTKRIPERKIGAVFIDPFVGAHQINENDNMAVNAVVAQIRQVADETNCAIGLVHHIRKGNGEDATIDSVRGAGSLIGAARAARVINKVSEQDALSLGVGPKEAQGLFRVDDGKANLAPPASAAVFRRMEGVQIGNGEWVGVATPFALPDEWEGMTPDTTNEILRIIDLGIPDAEGNEEYYSARPQDKERWVGNVITHFAFDNPDHAKNNAQAKRLISQWFKTGLLEDFEYRSVKQRKERKGTRSTGRVGEQR